MQISSIEYRTQFGYRKLSKKLWYRPTPTAVSVPNRRPTPNPVTGTAADQRQTIGGPLTDRWRTVDGPLTDRWRTVDGPLTDRWQTVDGPAILVKNHSVDATVMVDGALVFPSQCGSRRLCRPHWHHSPSPRPPTLSLLPPSLLFALDIQRRWWHHRS